MKKSLKSILSRISNYYYKCIASIYLTLTGAKPEPVRVPVKKKQDKRS